MASGQTDLNIIAGLQFADVNVAVKNLITEINRQMKGASFGTQNVAQNVISQSIRPKYGSKGNIVGWNVGATYTNPLGEERKFQTYIRKDSAEYRQMSRNLTEMLRSQGLSKSQVTSARKQILMGDLGGRGGLELLSGQAEAWSDKTATATKNTKSLGDEISKLFRRSAMVIPLWMAMRTVYTAVFDVIGKGVTYIKDLNDVLVKSRAVVSGVDNLPEFMGRLRKEITSLSLETGRSVKEIGDIFYRFAETGLDAEASLAGMRTALKLSVATFSDSAETARMLVDIYNMFKDTIEGTEPLEKMERIAGTFAFLWKRNAGNLNEYIEALKNFGSVAKNMNLTMEETLTLVTVLHNFMQRGSSAGTQLARALEQMVKNKSRVEEFLQIRIDPNDPKWLDKYLMIMEKMRGNQGTSQAALDIFGQRAFRGTTALSIGLDKLEEMLKIMKEIESQGLTDVFNELYENGQNLTTLLEGRIANALGLMGQEFFTALTGAENYNEALRVFADFLITKAIPAAEMFGERLRDLVAIQWRLAIEAKRAANLSLDSYFTMVPGHNQEGLTQTLLDYEIEMDKLRRFEEGVEDPNKSKRRADIAKAEAYKDRIDAAQRGIEGDDEGMLAFAYSNREGQLKRAEQLKYLGFTSLAIEQAKLKILKEQKDEKDGMKKIEEQMIKIDEMRLEEAYKYSAELRKTFQGSLGKVLTGESGWGDLLSDFNKKIGEQAVDVISEGITNSLMNFTGLDTLFGDSFYKIKSMYGDISDRIEIAHQTVYDLIVRGHRDGMSESVGGVPTAVWSGSGGGIIGGVLNQGIGNLLGYNPNLSQSFYPQGANASNFSLNLTPKQRSQMNRNNFVGALAQGGLVSSALTGYGMYQATRSSGGSTGAALMSGSLAGLGSLAGIGAGAMFGGAYAGMGASATAMGALGLMGPVGWGLMAAAVALPLLSTLWSKGKKSQTTISTETRTTENQISSRIDVTNKSLEIVNRNLVALRSDIRTYILPASAYFAEKNNLEAEFALMSRRGFQG